MQSMPTRPTSSKVLLVTDERSPAASATPVPIRRFKIARVRPENRVAASGQNNERRAA